MQQDVHGLPIIDQSFQSRLPGSELRADTQVTKLQINLGLYCNLACRHCHVASSPKRTADSENMSSETANKIIGWLKDNPTIKTVDLTGGSPEANPQFRPFVTAARELGISVMDRCNPTIIGFQNPNGQDYQWIPDFLAEHEVTVVASLPCYLEDNVRQQRGRTAYSDSINGLLALNAVGYGSDSRLTLNLVYNPTGPHLPPPSGKLADDYHRELKDRFGLVFNELWTITNMPIQRWRDDLSRKDELTGYMTTLSDAFNPDTVDELMCRHQIHVDSQGRVYDCDFNYALGMSSPDVKDRFIWDLPLEQLQGRRIATAEHCLGCTAGSGSSCGGDLVSIESV